MVDAPRESETTAAEAFWHGPYAMLVVRLADWVYVDVNHAFEQLFECERAHVVGARSAELGLWADPAERERLVEEVEAQGRVRELAAHLRSLRGEPRDVLLSGERVLLGGEPHLIAVARDVTRSLATERSKAELEAQLRQAQKLEALGTLAGGIAHDFNNILGAMVAFIDLIRLDVNDRLAVLDHVGELKSATQRARELVQQILTFSRAQKPARSVIQLELGVRDAIKLLRSTLPSSIEFRSTLDAAPAILGDVSQLHQIVMNLGTNAAHALRERGGELSVHVDQVEVDAALARGRPELRPGRYARLRVRDDGHGMDEATLKRVFEPFFTTKKQGEGTGLGLAVVHGIVRDHEGAIRLESQVGRGTTVEIHLPEHPGERAEREPSPLALPRGRGERILIVDDEEVLCQSLTQLLNRLGYQAESRSNPQDALELFRSEPTSFALVLTDLTMPGMTGLELSQRILMHTPTARVALMTGFSGTWTPDTVQSLGLVGMLVKPLSAAVLAEGVARALSRATVQ